MATKSATDPIAMLEADHRKVEDLFSRIESADADARQDLVQELVTELRVHMQLEEEHVYPLLESEGEQEMAEEAEVEHRLAREGMENLEKLSPDEPGFDGALAMVRAGIEHHVHEEETEALPKLREQLGQERLTELGEQLMSVREELMASMAKGGKASAKASGGKRGNAGKGDGKTKGGADVDEEMSKAELVERAKEAGISGYSSMKKDELIDALKKA